MSASVPKNSSSTSSSSVLGFSRSPISACAPPLVPKSMSGSIWSALRVRFHHEAQPPSSITPSMSSVLSCDCFMRPPSAPASTSFTSAAGSSSAMSASFSGCLVRSARNESDGRCRRCLRRKSSVMVFRSPGKSSTTLPAGMSSDSTTPCPQ